MLQLERIERRVLSSYQGLLAAGASVEGLPTVEEVQEEFLLMLGSEAEVVVIDAEQAELHAVIGLA